MKPTLRSALLLPTLLFAATTARAVVVYTGNTAESAAYYSAPSDYAAGWSYVGTASNASGGTVVGSVVYLGDYSGSYWVITAAHVGLDQGVASVTLNGSTYAVIAGSMVQLTNGDGSGTDLVMFRVAGDSALSSLANLSISTSTPTAGSTIQYVGNSYARDASLTRWNSSWSTVPSGGTYTGYTVSGAMTKSWGENTVAGAATISVGGRTVSAFSSTFSASNGSAMLFTGDSGGATFLKKSDGSWVLAGINEAIATYNGQPGSTAVAGDVSYSTDLSVYASQINAMFASAVPEPSAYALAGCGALLGLGIVRRSRRRAA